MFPQYRHNASLIFIRCFKFEAVSGTHEFNTFLLQLTENRSKRGGLLRFVVCEMPRADLLQPLQNKSILICSIL